MISLKYRSDIDGLRAVAVLGVVIYHAFPHALPGGFTGVDIFFVISGYLISGILYKGHNQGNFSFKEFYARRIRRLFPALITVLLLCLAYGWIVLLPDEFRQLGKHVAAGTLFIQNIVFWQESGYFDTAANLKPLLHLWSLAVEEQFYIFFPPLLIVLWKKPKLLVPAMVVLLVATFILNLVMSVQNSTTDFFLTPYRAWEFLGGSLLAWWHYDKNPEPNSEDVPSYREALSWIGLLLLGLGMAFIHTGDAYPGWRAILPVAGTLMLMEGGRGAWVNRNILSHPAVVWIGLISYPLYLFHWPALSFVHIVKGENPKPGYIIGALLVSFVMTVMTYYFIEKKIRHNKSVWTVPALVGAFLLVGISGLLSWQSVIKTRLNQVPWVLKVNQAVEDMNMMASWPQEKHGHGFVVNRLKGDGKCTLFFGDSNMEQYAPRIYKILSENKENTREAVFIAHGGVVPIPGLSNSKISDWEEMFKAFDDELATNPRVDRVVIAARWSMYFEKYTDWSASGVSLREAQGREEALQKLDGFLNKLRAAGKQITLVLTIPTGGEFDPKNHIMRTMRGISYFETPSITKAAFLQKEGRINSEIASIGRKNGALVIDPVDNLCYDGICIADDGNGISIRNDGGHLRPGYVQEHVKYLDQTVAP
jgi:peptidoglycan/LPS O-acetylase OafA/YrhL